MGLMGRYFKEKEIYKKDKYDAKTLYYENIKNLKFKFKQWRAGYIQSRGKISFLEKLKIIWFFRKERWKMRKLIRQLTKIAKIGAKKKYKIAKVQRKMDIAEEKRLKISKSNLHEAISQFLKIRLEDRINHLLVFELYPSKETKLVIKKRVFSELGTYSVNNDKYVHADDKDIVFLSFEDGRRTEKIPYILQYVGTNVPVYLEKIRNETNEEFSSDKENQTRLYCNMIRETKPKFAFKFNGKIIFYIMLAIIGAGILYWKFGPKGAGA